MKKNILIITLICVMLTLQGQKSENVDIVKMNTKFTLKLEPLDSIHYSFKVVEAEPFNQTVDLSNAKSLFDDSVGDGYIQGIFTYGKFGNKTKSFLFMKNGLNQPLNYNLKTKVKSKKNPIKTSVIALYPNVISTELWPYDIEYLMFSNFEIKKQFEGYIFEKPTIDSTCIKNTQNNQRFADSLFVSYVDTLNYYFFSSSGLCIEKVIDFEKGINSVDATRNYFVLIGEGIYPNKKKFNLDKTIDYKRIECPYFATNINYYYSKKENLVRVILFEWNVFKETDDIFTNDMDIEQKDKVFKEKFSKIETVLTSLLGTPTYKEIESEKGGANCRDGIKWINEGTLNAYLFMFGGNETNYRQIRLAIYKE